MTGGPTFNVAWRRLWMDVEIARHYRMPSSLHGGPSPNPILDELHPSILFVNMVSLLDEAFGDFIEKNSIPLPRGYRHALYDRIELLNAQGRLQPANDVHTLRLKRNSLAHGFSRIKWKDFDSAADLVESSLLGLQLILPRPLFKAYVERSAAKLTGEAGTEFTQDFCFGLKENGKRILEVSWTLKFG